MPGESSLNDLFRFIQLRPKRQLDETPSVELMADTAVAKKLVHAPSARRRMEVANDALPKLIEIVGAPEDVPLGEEIVAAIAELAPDDGATTEDLIDRLPGVPDLLARPQFNERAAALSDTLLAAFYATERFALSLPPLESVYRVYDLLRRLRVVGVVAGEDVVGEGEAVEAGRREGDLLA